MLLLDAILTYTCLLQKHLGSLFFYFERRLSFHLSQGKCRVPSFQYWYITILVKLHPTP